VRSTYRRVSERNGPTLVPLELATGLIERATPAPAQSVPLGYAKHDLRGEDFVAAHRRPPSHAAIPPTWSTGDPSAFQPTKTLGLAS
jgi:hypothetical protein